MPPESDIIAQTAQRWADPQRRPLFKGSLINANGRCCAQGDVLRACGRDDDYLRDLPQEEADRETAEALGISVFHAVLLRHVNDSADGQPERCLLAERVPEYGLELLGPMHADLFALGRRLGTMSRDQIAAAGASRAAAEARVAARASRAAAGSRAAAREAARDSARELGVLTAEARALWEAAWALCVRDLIGERGFSQEHYDTLTRPVRGAGVVVHPDDAPLG